MHRFSTYHFVKSKSQIFSNFSPVNFKILAFLVYFWPKFSFETTLAVGTCGQKSGLTKGPPVSCQGKEGRNLTDWPRAYFWKSQLTVDVLNVTQLDSFSCMKAGQILQSESQHSIGPSECAAF